MHRSIALVFGILLIASGLLGASLTWSVADDVHAQERDPAGETTARQDDANDSQANQAHVWMSAMMDLMTGAGFSERMQAAMPGSEAMMKACASSMEGMMSEGGMHIGGMMDHAD